MVLQIQCAALRAVGYRFPREYLIPGPLSVRVKTRVEAVSPHQFHPGHRVLSSRRTFRRLEQYAPEPRMRLNLGIRRRLAPLLGNDRARIELANSLLFTLPGRDGDIVLGKFAAGAIFIAVLVGIVGLFASVLFFYGDPEIGKTISGALGLLLVGWTYVAIGGFASSLTRSQVVSFLITFGSRDDAES